MRKCVFFSLSLSRLILARVITQNVQLIELAYKSISFDDLQKLFGFHRKMVEQICNDHGWQVDSGGIYVLPKRSGLSLIIIYFSFIVHLF